MVNDLADRFPFVPLLAWRPHLLGLLGAGSLVAARPGRRFPGVILALVAAAGLTGAVARTRGAVWDRHAGDLTVMVANVWKQRADPHAVAGLVRRHRPHLVCLPEADSGYRDALEPLLPGYRAWASRPPGLPRTSGLTLLVADTAGDVHVDLGEDMVSGPIAVTGGILGERTFHAVHTTSPTRPGEVREWRDDLAAIGRWTRGPVAPIVAGDLNSTLDHAAFRRAMGRCRSAADLAGRGLIGTFPAVIRGVPVPRRAGILIDHVLVPSTSEITHYEVVDVPGSDHRGVVVAFRP